MVIANVQCVVLDCPDVLQLAEFYQALLGGAVNEPDPKWTLGETFATLHLESGLILGFQRSADHRPPDWPDPARPQQFHLDLGVADLAVAERLVQARGCRRLDDGANFWRIYADPAGHPFCLLQEKSV
jgi:hypothetical protein